MALPDATGSLPVMLAAAGRSRQAGQRIPHGQPVRAGHDGDDQAVAGLRGEAEVDPPGHDDLFLPDAGVELGETGAGPGRHPPTRDRAAPIRALMGIQPRPRRLPGRSLDARRPP
jgi:hypothetical protein